MSLEVQPPLHHFQRLSGSHMFLFTVKINNISDLSEGLFYSRVFSLVIVT